MNVLCPMLSKREIKFIRSLQLKKFRDEERLFVVEGAKNLLELISSDFEIEKLAVTEKFHHKYEAKLTKLSIEPTITSQQNIEAAGTFKSNDSGLAVVKQRAISTQISNDGYILALDQVKDPGNMGTIIRTADWFGIKTIWCSMDSVDVYNPKVINSTMGSFTRVNVNYLDLNKALSSYDYPVYGALLEGTPIKEVTFDSNGVILMGNESQGIHQELLQFITHPVYIPKFGGAESLNVGVATGIICSQVRLSS